MFQSIQIQQEIIEKVTTKQNRDDEKSMIPIHKINDNIDIVFKIQHYKNVVGRIRTCAGEPNRFLVYLLNHSDTTTSHLLDYIHKHIGLTFT